MVAIRYEYPLKLPKNWTSTPPGQRNFNSNFPRTLTLLEAIRFFEDEINRLNADGAICYSNYQNLSNERLRKKIGNDSGISLMLKTTKGSFFIACDKWSLPEQNIYALHLTLRAIINIDEWGVMNVRQTLHAFPAEGSLLLQEQISKQPEWMTLLGVGPSATLDDAHALYRHKVKQCGNNEEELMRLNLAMDEAKRILS